MSKPETQKASVAKPANPNVFTPEQIIALREKYPTVGTLFVAGKTTQNAAGSTSYTKFNCMTSEGKPKKLVFKFANQLLAYDATPYEGKDKASAAEKKLASSVYLNFKQLDKETLVASAYPEAEHQALIDANTTYLRALKIINDELEFFQQKHVLESEDEEIAKGDSKKFTGIIRSTRNLSESEVKSYKKEGKKTKDVKVPLDKLAYQLKLSAAFGHGVKIGASDYQTKKFREIVFDLKRMAQYKKDNPDEPTCVIPLTIDGAPLTVENARKGLTRMSKISGVFTIDAVSKHAFGLSPSVYFDSLYVSTHKIMKSSYIDEDEITAFTNDVSADLNQCDEFASDMIEEPAKPTKKDRAPIKFESNDDEPDDNLDDDEPTKPANESDDEPTKPARKVREPVKVETAETDSDADDDIDKQIQQQSQPQNQTGVKKESAKPIEPVVAPKRAAPKRAARGKPAKRTASDDSDDQ